MSDKAKNTFPLNFNFIEGEQLTAQKLSLLGSLTKKGFVSFEKVLGDLRGDGTLGVPGNPEFTSQKSSNFRDIEVFTSYLSLDNNMVSAARFIGSAAAINPAFISGQEFKYSDLVAGWPIAPVRIQQLPFRPNSTSSTDFEWSGSGSVPTTLVASPDLVLNDGEWHVTSEGVLHTFQAYENVTLRYSLKTDQGDTYYKAYWNVIPDPSILRTENHLSKLVKVTFKFTGSDSHAFSVELPKVYSVHESIENGGPNIGGFEPVGVNRSGARMYDLNPDLYGPGGSYVDDGRIAPNTLLLWDSIDREVIEGDFELTEDPGTYIVHIPCSATLKATDGSSLVGTETVSDSRYFLLAVGTQLSNLVSQLRTRMNSHRHDGIDSSRISHWNLMDAFGLPPGFDPNFYFAAGGENNRIFRYSKGRDNVHPQYLHRFGFRYGGTAGFYPGLGLPLNFQDLNMFEGDLVMGPLGDVSEEGDGSPIDLLNVIRAAPNFKHSQTSKDSALARSPSFSIIFGQPKFGGSGGSGEGLGATRFNYEVEAPASRDEETVLEMSGLPLGDSTSGQDENTRRRGANITWGNLFFGIKEDAPGGLHDDLHQAAYGGVKNRSFSGLFAEFNAVVTANSTAGENKNKSPYTPIEDGFNVQAIKGASVSFKVGGYGSTAPDEVPDSAKTGFGRTGVFAVQARRNETDDADERFDSFTGSGTFLGLAHSLSGNLYNQLPWGGPILSSNLVGRFSTGLLTPGLLPRDGGSLAYLASYSPLKRYDPANFVGRGSLLKGANAVPFGKVLIEGSNGVQLLTPTPFQSELDFGIEANFETGKNLGKGFWPHLGAEVTVAALGKKEDEAVYANLSTLDENWESGPTRLTGNGFEAENVSPRGGNINLLYGYEHVYTRFGLRRDWSSGDENGEGGSPYMKARTDNLQTPRALNAGSNIRAASTVEAFNGFRSDPYQPYTAKYTIPIKVKARIPGVQASGIDMSGSDGKWTFTLGSLTEPDTYSTNDSPMHEIASGHGYRLGWHPYNSAWTHDHPEITINGTSVKLSFDALIRHHDAMLAFNNVPQNGNLADRTYAPGHSLTNWDISLDYYAILSNVNGIEASSQALVKSGSPASPNMEGLFDSIRSGSARMVNSETLQFMTGLPTSIQPEDDRTTDFLGGFVNPDKDAHDGFFPVRNRSGGVDTFTGVVRRSGWVERKLSHIDFPVYRIPGGEADLAGHPLIPPSTIPDAYNAIDDRPDAIEGVVVGGGYAQDPWNVSLSSQWNISGTTPALFQWARVSHSALKYIMDYSESEIISYAYMDYSTKSHLPIHNYGAALGFTRVKPAGGITSDWFAEYRQRCEVLPFLPNTAANTDPLGYRGLHNSQWSLLIEGSLNPVEAQKGYFPFRIFPANPIGDEVSVGNSLWMEITGHLTLEFITQKPYAKLEYQ